LAKQDLRLIFALCLNFFDLVPKKYGED
jgi:hypothetical protein